MTLKQRFPSLVKAVNGPQGLVTAVVSVYGNVDAQNDRVMPGAFDATIAAWQAKMAKGQYLPVVYGHTDDPEAILGKVVAMRDTAEGLEVDEQFFLEKPLAKSTFEAHQQGVLEGSSFAYDIKRARRNNDGVLELMELDLLEVGPTIYPANNATRLVGVKSGRTLSASTVATVTAALDAMEQSIAALRDFVGGVGEKADEPTDKGKSVTEDPPPADKAAPPEDRKPPEFAVEEWEALQAIEIMEGFEEQWQT